MNSLLLVIPFCQKDHVNAAQLLRWMAELQPEGYKSHSCLLAVDNTVPIEIQREVFDIAKTQFFRTDRLTIPVPQDRQNWIGGSNFMFEQTSRTINECIKLPFFWCEPDCIPLKPGWLDQLADAYAACPRRFMGAHVQAVNQPNMPALHMAGCAIYDCHAYNDLKPFVQQTSQAFDIAAAQYTVMRSMNTPLIQHFWGKPGLAPTFRETKSPSDPENTVPMGFIKPETAIWHRCKDGTLIDCLRQRKAVTIPDFPQASDGKGEYQKVVLHIREPESGEPDDTPVQPFPKTQIVKRGPGRPRKNPVPEPVTS